MTPDASRHEPQSPTQRSLARNARAAKVLPTITLDRAHADRLSRILARTGESVAAFVRRAIREHQ